MEQTDFLAMWNRPLGANARVQLPPVPVSERSWQGIEPQQSFFGEWHRKWTAKRQAELIGNTVRQVELDLARAGLAEWLYVRVIEVSAHNINALYYWADECSGTCHPDAQQHIEMMVQQGAVVLSRLPMAAFIQNIRRYGLG
jgi:hypothetical protein